MKITFLGASQTVTGSCYLLETKATKFLVDCGLFQGGNIEESLNYEPFAFNPNDIDFMILSHAHIDHSGRIPKLYKDGFKGKIYCTNATLDLCRVMLPDSGHIQESEIEWINRKRKRMGKEPIEPLYTMEDALKSLDLFFGLKYDEFFRVNDEIAFTLRDAGHMLGSSIIELYITEENKTYKVVFSGDLGNKNIPILKDPTIIDEADYLIIESTYGNRLHDNSIDKTEKFLNIINNTIKKNGKVIIPSFAVGRTQEILYEIYKNYENNNEKISFLEDIEVYVDSPLATSASDVYKKHIECFDSEATEFIKRGSYPLEFKNLKFTKSVEESKWLNEYDKPCIIISSSGMCEAGRIKHHLKHNLWKENTTVLFVGYQAPNTLGRRILDGEKKVKILGEEIEIKANIEYIEAYSGHADQNGLYDWVSHINKLQKVFIVHGEIESQKAFSDLLVEKLNLDVTIPQRGDIFEITPSYLKSAYKLFSDRSQFINLTILSEIEEINNYLQNLRHSLRNTVHQTDKLIEIGDSLDEIRYMLNMINGNL
ncbi:MBL fold metallo-hydrolase RNA specificity domain-containing protein [Caldicellulosiruptoraceae bacterium PP1]